MAFKFGSTSEAMLAQIHPDMVRVCRRALQISPYDFGINRSSVRSIEEQRKFVDEGKSQTMNSRHIVVSPEDFSMAVDINVYVNGKYINGDTAAEVGYYRKVNQAFVTAAIEEGVQIELGCLWRTFVDGPHIELSREYYP